MVAAPVPAPAPPPVPTEMVEATAVLLTAAAAPAAVVVDAGPVAPSTPPVVLAPAAGAGAPIAAAAPDVIAPSAGAVPAGPLIGAATGAATGAAGTATAGAGVLAADGLIAPGTTSTILSSPAGGVVSAGTEQATARGPPPGAVLIRAAVGGSVTSGPATLTFAAGSLPADAWVTVTPVDVLVHGLSVRAYDLAAIDVLTGELIENFNTPPVLTIASDLSGGLAQAIWYLPPDGTAPVLIDSVVSAADGTVSAGLPHFSTYVVSPSTTLTITLSGTSARTIKVTATEVVVTDSDGAHTESLSGITSLVITPGGGDTQNDTLTIDATDGAITVAVTFDGGAGTNNVTFVLAGDLNRTINVSATSSALNVAVSGKTHSLATASLGTVTIGVATDDDRNDDLVVNVTTTSVAVPIVFNPGDGENSVTLTGATSSVWTVGALNALGTSTTVVATAAAKLTSLTFVDVTKITSDSSDDTLVGANRDTTWRTASDVKTGAMSVYPGFTSLDLFFFGFEKLTGGSGTDTLMAPTEEDILDADAVLPATTTWTLGASDNAGTVAAGSSGWGFSFSSMEILAGDPSRTDVLVARNTTNAWTVDGSKTRAGTLNAVLTFTGFDTITGGSGADTVTGPSAGLMWRLTGTGAATVQMLSFTGVETLTGGTGSDTAVGPDTALTWNYWGSAIDISPIGIRLINFDRLIGGTAADTLDNTVITGLAWTLTGIQRGTLGSLAFGNFDVLEAGSALDTLAAPVAVDFTSGNASALGMTLTFDSGMADVAATALAKIEVGGTSGDDTITIEAGSSAGLIKVTLVYSVLGFPITRTYELSVPSAGGELVITGEGGEDTIEIKGLPANFAGKVLVYGGDVLRTPGAASGAELAQWIQSFMDVADVDDTIRVTGNVNTQGYDFVALGTTFELASGISINTGSGGTWGDVTIWARKLGLNIENSSPGFGTTTRNATITIGNDATITGGTVALRAITDDVVTLAQALGAENTAQLASLLVLEAIVSAISGLIPVRALVKESTATVTIGTGVDITAKTGALDVLASSSVNSVAAISMLVIFSGGYVHAVATAQITIGAGSILTSELGRVDILSNASAKAKLEATSAQDLDDQAIATGATDKFVIAVVAVYAKAVSLVTLAETAEVHAATFANLRADGLVSGIGIATAGGKPDGTASIAITVEVTQSDIRAQVDGTVTADGTVTEGTTPVFRVSFDPTASAGQTGYVNEADDSIIIGPHAFQTGDAVVYRANSGAVIGGVLALFPLFDGQTYYVIRVNATTIKLADTLLGAFAGRAHDIAGFSATTNKKDFNSGTVDATTDIITLDNDWFSGNNAGDWSVWPKAFALGQAVKYTQGTSTIGGLVNGTVYYVIADTGAINLTGDYDLSPHQAIKLARTYQEALAGIAIDLTVPTGTGHRLTALQQLVGGSTPGVGVVANLSAEDQYEAKAGMGRERPDSFVAEFLKGTTPFKWAKGKVKAFTNWAGSPFKKLAAKILGNDLSLAGSTGFAGALALGYADHETHTSGGVTTGGVRAIIGKNAVLRSANDVSVTANITERQQAAVDSFIKPDVLPGGAPVEKENAVSIAVALGFIYNTATVDVLGDATDQAVIDAVRATRIGTDVSMPFLGRLDGIPLSLNALVSSVRSQGVTGGLTAINALLQPQSAVELLRKYFANSWARSLAVGKTIGVAGSVSTLNIANEALTTVGDAVKINRTETNNANQMVVIVARNRSQLIEVVGNFDTLLRDLFGGTDTSGKKKGVGAAFGVTVLTNTTKAITGSAQIRGAKGVSVLAEEGVFHLVLGQSGGASDTLAFSGTFTSFTQDSTTLAQVGAGATVDGGAVSILAGSNMFAISASGDVSSGKGIGIGVTVVNNNILRSTKAVVGALDLANPGASTSVTSTGPLRLESISDGTIFALGVAALEVANSPADAPAPNQMKALSILGGVADAIPAKTAVGVAGAAAVNVVDDTTHAYFNALGSLGGVSSGAVTVSARDSFDVIAITGAAAVMSAQASKSSTGLAGAFSINTVTMRTQALVIGPTVRGASFNLTASRSGLLITGAIGAAGSKANPAVTTSDSGSGSVSVGVINSTTYAKLRNADATITGALTVSATDSTELYAVGGAVSIDPSGRLGVGATLGLNFITRDTQAAIESISPAATPTISAGSVGVTGDNTGKVVAVAVSLAVGQSAVGFTVAVNLIDTQAGAKISRVTLTTTAGDVAVYAHDGTFLSSGVGGFAFSLVSKAPPAQTAKVRATVGLSIAVNELTRQDTLAGIDSAAVTAKGNVSVTALSDGDIIAVTVAGVGSFGGDPQAKIRFQGAGAISVNTITGQTRATLGGTGTTVRSGVNADTTRDVTKTITLSATDTSDINANAGGVSIAYTATGPPSTTTVTLGAAAAQNEITKTVEAAGTGVTLDSAGAVSLAAAATGTIWALALGIAGAVSTAGGSGLSGAGSGTGNEITSNVYATLTNGTTTAGGSVTLSATDTSTITASSGGVAVLLARGPPNGGGTGAIGLSIALNRITPTVSAKIDGSKVTAAGALSLTAISTATIWTLSIGGAVAGGGGGGTTGTVAVGGSTARNDIGGSTTARILNSGTGKEISAAGAITLTATSDNTVDAYSVGGAVAVGVGDRQQRRARHRPGDRA